MPDAPHPVDPVQLGAYFALIDVSSLLRHAIEQQLHVDGDLTFVQFQILRRLQLSSSGSARMTALADSIVISRSGLTYQAGTLERRDLVTRGPSPDDERSVIISVTDAGRALVDAVLPGHEAVVKQMFFDPLSRDGARSLTDLLGPVGEHMRTAPPPSAAPRRRKRG
ncbi:MarR family winged helix-turn-helix transcriptional regulator [Pseudonocardia endophytica]|uniref:DNA-binding MarR family transcriptional regulator n=1 Tax=Pseudonocardia endophytica TaxID=401976 RepID=A0A4R1HGY4_PSEEN|nr:MarR family transcriptional regulator [Pseudonocardia endophytica]TCK21447.1 DNA-binding MarR family transcriptional regulator [Pseudonocardia endophytica]